MLKKKAAVLTRSTTGRGFGRIFFTDRYGQQCSLQDSSLAEEAALWFGVDNTGPSIEGSTGKRNEDIMARMHLTVPMVKALIPFLQEFVKTQQYLTENAKYVSLSETDTNGQKPDLTSVL